MVEIGTAKVDITIANLACALLQADFAFVCSEDEQHEDPERAGMWHYIVYRERPDSEFVVAPAG